MMKNQIMCSKNGYKDKSINRLYWYYKPVYSITPLTIYVQMSTDNNETKITEEKNATVPLSPTDYTVIIERLTGTVKWFNNKAGFGFITVCEPGEYYEKDIFVHYSSIRVSNSQYKYLVQGEYIDFTLVKANNGHEFQAMDVSGVKGGPIMCESRRISAPVSTGYSQNGPPSQQHKQRTDNKPTRKNDNTPRTKNPPAVDQTSQGTGEDMLGYATVTKKRRPPRSNVQT